MYKIIRPKLNLVGKRFSKLLVVGIFERTKSGYLWMCRCDCGNEIIKLTTQLTRLKEGNRTGCHECESLNRSLSCGLRTHGECELGKTRLYGVWKSMISRCSNPKNKHYFGKGISVCDDWKWYPTFKNWAYGNGYRDDVITNGRNQLTTIERKNSNGNYEPANCEFITAQENSRRMAKGLSHG
jgi:hypothetical protein